MRNMTRPPRTYELMTILAPDVPEEQIGPAVDQIKGYITGAGGTVSEILQDSPWGRRRLAYPIRHNGHDVRDGHYTVFHFDLEPGQVSDVEREILLNDQIIRYLVTVYTAPPPSSGGEQAGEPGESAAEAEQEPAASAAGAEETAAEAPAVEAEANEDTSETAGEAPETTNAIAGSEAESSDDVAGTETDDEQTEPAE